MDEQKILDAIQASNENLARMMQSEFTTINRKLDEHEESFQWLNRKNDDALLGLRRINTKVDKLHDAVVERVEKKEVRLEALETEFEELQVQREKAVA